MGAIRAAGAVCVNHLCSLHPRLAELRMQEAITRTSPGIMASLRIPGLQCAFGFHGRPLVTLAMGVADQSTGVRMMEATQFIAASLSKPISALVTLRLAAAGLIDLHEPIAGWLGPIRSAIPASHLPLLTPYRLLSHSAGLGARNAPYFDRPAASPSLLDLLSSPNRVSPPLLTFLERPAPQTYSGMGYALLQAALEARLNRSWAMLARMHLFEPLSLAEPFFGSVDATPHAREHDASGKVLPSHYSPCLASSGLISDCASIATMLRAAARVGDDPSVLLPEELSNAFTHVPRRDAEAMTPRSPRGFTLGMHLSDAAAAVPGRTDTLMHGGFLPGSRVIAMLMPGAGSVFVAFANGARASDLLKPLCGLYESLHVEA